MLVAIIARWTRSGSAISLEQVRAEWGSTLPLWRDLPEIRGYHDWRAGAAGDEYLDDRTWADLHLDEVFGEVDRTRSTVGRQALYHRLRAVPAPDDLARFESVALHFADHEEERERAQVLLSRLSHAAGYRLWAICRRDSVTLRWWYAAFPLLAMAAMASILGYFVWPRALLALLVIAIVNITLRIKLHWRIHHLLGPFRQIAPLLVCAEYLERMPLGEARLGEVRRSLDRLRSLKFSSNWASREVSWQNELAASTWEYLNVLFLFDANAMLLASRTLQACREDLLTIIEFVGEIDAAISTASLRAGSSQWCTPEFVAPGRATFITDAIHPIVNNAVPNSIELRPGRGLIVTGSNMSGKSTFLRTVGLCVVLAQTINTCPARAYASPRLKVRSAIGRSDDLAEGKSYYLVEVEAVLSMLRDASSESQRLFLFDELFRGTNTAERLAAGEAVLDALPKDGKGAARHIVVAATHDLELVDMLAGSYDPFHFRDSVTEGGLSFDFVIRPGRAQTRNAIALLEIRGAPKEIIERARRTVDDLGTG